MRYALFFLTALSVALTVGSGAMAGEFESRRQQNWHQWRGPDATGVATNANPPIEWSQTKNIKWKTEIPG
ncbi:MAG TPA: hypothetical protein VGM98_25640, partial [Schlesneria sp.]